MFNFQFDLLYVGLGIKYNKQIKRVSKANKSCVVNSDRFNR